MFDQSFNNYRIRAVLNDLGFSPSKDEPFSPVFFVILILTACQMVCRLGRSLGNILSFPAVFLVYGFLWQ